MDVDRVGHIYHVLPTDVPSAASETGYWTVWIIRLAQGGVSYIGL